MQFVESMISFVVLLSFSLFLFIQFDEGIDNSLYLYKLQGDVKNVIHLKGGFENLRIGNEVAEEILEKTGLCVEMGETELTSRIVKKNFASLKLVPRLRTLSLDFNGTKKDLENENLTAFLSDDFFLGLCAND